MIPFKLHRICTIMKPEYGYQFEVEGVLNPVVARGPDPMDVERLGIELEPETDYEKRTHGGGGCEDPRTTYVKCVEHYIMIFTAYGPKGPRIAMARSKDLFNWERMGLISFKHYKSVDFNNVDDKDASFFPLDLPSPHNHNSIAMLHRPLFPDTIPEIRVKLGEHRKIDKHKESIWISYFNLKQGKNTSLNNARFTSHHCLAHPVYPWENLKIGGGGRTFHFNKARLVNDFSRGAKT